MEGTESSSATRVVIIIVVLAVLAVGGYFLYQKGGGSAPTPEGEAAPVKAVLAPGLELSVEEQSGDVSAKKAGILALVNSGRTLTAEQKSEIGGIMLTKSHIYQFTEPERVKIFEALQR